MRYEDRVMTEYTNVEEKGGLGMHVVKVHNTLELKVL